MKKSLIIPILAVLGLAVVALLFFALHQRSEMSEMVEQLEFEKEELQDEYEDLAIQFDGYQQMEVSNDSLTQRLAQEQQRVRDLLEELKITKATNARRIAELKKELATVRAVMVTYVHQIDSLNRTNARLSDENQEYRRQNEEITQQNTELIENNTQLQKTVNRASMLEVQNFEVVTLNKRDRKTSIFSAIQKLEIHYAILKNVTCEPGIKKVYLRIVRPDGEVLQKSASHVFPFESGRLEYSICQEVEYGGERMESTMYWPVEEILEPGTYNADFFIDGNMVGSFPFQLKK
ncbi:MAG: hypothetical protein MJZ82_03550 [Paludibacteraceae bacterium]|nr:hypothetical protein [Paludibacteraceae bacterium]